MPSHFSRFSSPSGNPALDLILRTAHQAMTNHPTIRKHYHSSAVPSFFGFRYAIYMNLVTFSGGSQLTLSVKVFYEVYCSLATVQAWTVVLPLCILGRTGQ